MRARRCSQLSRQWARWARVSTSGRWTFSPASPLFIDIVGAIGFFLYWPALGMILLTFPTGRFAPRWTCLLILLWIVQIPLYGVLSHEGSPLPIAAERLIVWGSSFAVLFYRYRYLYNDVQRQQTKWLLYGFVPFYLLYLLYGALQSIPTLNTPDSLYLVVGPILLLLSHIIVPLPSASHCCAIGCGISMC